MISLCSSYLVYPDEVVSFASEVELLAHFTRPLIKDRPKVILLRVAYSTVQYSAVQCDTEQHDAALYSALEGKMAQRCNVNADRCTRQLPETDQIHVQRKEIMQHWRKRMMQHKTEQDMSWSGSIGTLQGSTGLLSDCNAIHHA